MSDLKSGAQRNAGRQFDDARRRSGLAWIVWLFARNLEDQPRARDADETRTGQTYLQSRISNSTSLHDSFLSDKLIDGERVRRRRSNVRSQEVYPLQQ